MTRLSRRERAALVALLLAAWALRWAALMAAPPGWRDDDLIELYTFSGRIAAKGPVLYFAGASGHEPLYHTLRAPVVALAGINQASARWVSATAGVLTTLLTWAVGRRIFGRTVGLTGAGLTAVAFWSLMYSRVAIRHIGMTPWALLALYWAWRQLQDAARPGARAVIGIAAGAGGALLTYYAGRLVPALLVAALPIIILGDLRDLTGWKRRARRLPGYLAGLGLGLLLAAPMFWTAAHLPGADARVGELAVPLHALREGDLGPLIQTTWTTLGMFHARGDPEWLYNVSERPVFGPVTAALFYLSLGLNLVQWRRPGARLLLLWLAAGIAPAFISLPPSSYGHTILAMPAVYLSLARLVRAAPAKIAPVKIAPVKIAPAKIAPAPGRMRLAVGLLLLTLVGARDLPDYFVDWSGHGMVRFLYRADYRALADHLDERGMDKTAVGSMLYGPWDKVALATDAPETYNRVRWLNPARALVFAEGQATDLFLQNAGERQPEIAALLARAQPLAAPGAMEGYRVAPPDIPPDAMRQDAQGRALADQPFGGALTLDGVVWQPPTAPNDPAWLATWWTVRAALPLPEERLIPNPPPPGVYNGPRLKVYAHLGCGPPWDDAEARCAETWASIDDGMWVDPYSLRPGDRLLQYHRFEESEAANTVTLGLYDPLTGARWTTEDGSDGVVILLGPAKGDE